MPLVDRSYLDYQWLADLDSSHITFVTRLKSNADIDVVEEFLPNERHEHILSVEDIKLTGFYTSGMCPDRLRVIRFCEAENDQTLTLLTNQLS